MATSYTYSVEIVSYPTKLTYRLHESFDVTGLKVYIDKIEDISGDLVSRTTYNDTDFTINGNGLKSPACRIEDSDGNLVDYESLPVGSFNLTIRSELASLTIKYKIVVNDYQVSIEPVNHNTYFFYGDEFSEPNTFDILVYYESGAVKSLKSDLGVDPMSCLWYYPTIAKNDFEYGLKYNGLTYKVEAHCYRYDRASDISYITYTPHNESHLVCGDTYSIDQDLLIVHYAADSRTAELTATDVQSNLSFSFPIGSEITSSDDQTITVTYLDTLTYDIKYTNAKLDSTLSISDNTTRFEVGEYFYKSKIKCIATTIYSGSTSENNVEGDCKFYYDGAEITEDFIFKKSEIGEHTIKIVYDTTIYNTSVQATAEYNINVANLNKVVLSNNCINQIYLNNFTLGDGFKAEIEFDDGQTRDVTSLVSVVCDYDVGSQITGRDNFDVMIVYTDGEGDTLRTASTTYTVRVYYYDRADDIDHIEMDGNQTTQFNYGDYFTLGNGTVRVVYKNLAGYSTISSSSLSIITPSINTLITTKSTQKASLTYTVENTDFICTYNYNIRYLDNLSINTDNVQKDFVQTDEFSSTNLTATATYTNTDGTNEQIDVTNSVSIYIGNDSLANAYILSSSGIQTIKVSYSDGGLTETTNYQINVAALTVTNLEITTNELSAEIEGELLFYQSRTLVSVINDTTKLLLTATYNNGNTISVNPAEYSLSPSVGTIFDTIGSKTITITYGGKTVSYNVNVVEDKISSLSISGYQTTYKVGDSFKISGNIVKATHLSGYEETIGYGTNGYSLSLDNGYTFKKSDITNSYSVTVTYGETTTSYSFSVYMPSVSSLSLDASNLGTTFKNGDSFDISNLKVTLIYANSYKEELTYNSGVPNAGDWIADLSNLTLSGGVFAETILGQKEITITGYSSESVNDFITTKMNVTIQPNKQLKNIYIVADNAKLTYSSGETFTGEGFKIRAYYQDTDEYNDIDVVIGNSNISTLNPSLGSTLYKTGQQTVTFFYTYLNVTQNATYTITVNPSYKTSKTTSLSLKIVKVKSLINDGDEISDFNSDGYIWALYNVNDTDIDTDEENETYNMRVLVNTSAKCYGYVIKGEQTADTAITTKNAKVVLFEDYQPPVEGYSNIIVKFPHYVDGYADRINHCTFGILYGTNNNKNKLFVSGNPDDGMGNLDWHSTEINVSQVENYEGISDGDLTYFSDLDYCSYGQLSNKVIGYDVIGNGTLMVLKTDSSQEPTIYYRTPETVSATAYDGSVVTDANGNTLTEIAFSCTTGNIGDGGISSKSVINYNGDTIFLTKTGLKGLDISSAIADNQRYANPRSTFIDKDLEETNIENCSLHVYKDWLLLTDQTKVYIANYNYRSNKEYEWWVFDNVYANNFIDINDDLFFTNTDGKIYKFDLDSSVYVDKERTFISRGGLIPTDDESSPMTINELNETILFNSVYKNKIIDGYTLTILGNYTSNQEEYHKHIYGFLGIFATQERIDNTVGIVKEDLQGTLLDGLFTIKCYGANKTINGVSVDLTEFTSWFFQDNQVVYLDHLILSNNDSKLNYLGKPYYVEDIGNYQFRLKDEKGNYLDTTNISQLRISYRVDEAIITNTTDTIDSGGGLTCNLLGTYGQIVDIMVYDYQSVSGFSGVVTTTTNVKAYYVTKPFNMDTNVYLKNIWSWTIVNDTELASYQDIGYLVDNAQKFYDYVIESTTLKEKSTSELQSSGSTEFDFGNFNFDRFTFNTNVMPTVYTSYRVLESIKYISFMLKNEDNTNCVLTNLSIEYTIGISNR